MPASRLPRNLPAVPPAAQLLVFAQTPPPVHGQSLMVRALVEHLPAAAPEIVLHHVNPHLSRDAADVGRVRPGKLVALLAACLRALALRLRHGPMVLYYVPAPAKRAALYRDWFVMLLCRPFSRGLVLHWHAVGLGAWLATDATGLERALTRLLLGRAALSLSLAPELLADAQALAPRRTAVLPNGIPPPIAAPRPAPRDPHAPTELLFLGLGTREKGLFDTLTALAIAHRREPGGFRLTVAGDFARPADQHAFFSQVQALDPGLVRHVGHVDAARKTALFAAADVFCFPTCYPHEGQPLVLLEALAHDLPIVTTRWRAIPGLLPAAHTWLVDPGRPDQLAAALLAARQAPRPAGQLRAHFLAHFTLERHLSALAAALAPLHLGQNAVA